MTRRTLVLLTASLLFLASIVGGLVQIGKRAAEGGVATQASALLAARSAAIGLYTVDPENVESQVDAVIDGATGDFLADYLAQREALIEKVRASKQELRAEVPADGTAIAHYRDDEAVVLVAVEVTSGAPAATEVTSYRVRLTMRHIGDAWKAATLDTLRPVAGPGIFIPGDLPSGNSAIASAAARAAEVMYAYDYRRAEEGRAAIRPFLTERFDPIFARIYAVNSTAALTKQSVIDSYARAAGLVLREGDRARCLVFLDQVVELNGTSTAAGTQLLVDLVRVDGRWLVDGVAEP